MLISSKLSSVFPLELQNNLLPCFPSQHQNPMMNGYHPPKQPSMANQVKRPTKPTADPNTLLTIASASTQQPASSAAKRKDDAALENGAEEEEEDDDDDDEDDDEDEDEEGSEEESDDGSSDRFSIKSDLAQVNEESSKARRTPLLFIRPHLRARFVFNQLLQVLPQSPSDTNQPATVEIISADVSVSLPLVVCRSTEQESFLRLGFTLNGTSTRGRTTTASRLHRSIDFVRTLIFLACHAH